jgi:hypothetical protein
MASNDASIREVSSSDLDHKTDFDNYRGLPQPHQILEYRQLGRNRFLPHPFEIIINWSKYKS